MRLVALVAMSLGFLVACGGSDQCADVVADGASPAAVIYCVKPVSAGSLTIPASIAKQMPPMGGMGLFQHMSGIAMSRSGFADVQGRTVQLHVARLHNLNVTHNLEGDL
ncbi:MAG TPA: hypothetical protein PLY68_11220 [Myxococcota bacterium]|nr:hypothetical protein [Myxococcota bacterium]HQP96748.1 hypothetical protein [Myxococcota bacterium]